MAADSSSNTFESEYITLDVPIGSTSSSSSIIDFLPDDLSDPIFTESDALETPALFEISFLDRLFDSNP